MNNQWKWYNILQYTALSSIALLMPIDWHNGSMTLWAMMALGVVSIIKCIAEWKHRSRAKHSPQEKGTRWIMWLMVVYWLCYVVAAPLSKDTMEAWSLVILKASIIVLPLCFLFTDMSYLTRERLRGVALCWVAGLGIRIIALLVRAGIRLAEGASWVAITNSSFCPRHHAYSALYAVGGVILILLLLFSIYRREWKAPRWLRIGLWAMLFGTVFYAVIVNSRAGMVTLATEVILAGLYLSVWRKRWLQGVVLVLLIGGFAVGVGAVLPGFADRIAPTLNDVGGGGEHADARLHITSSALKQLENTPLLGNGTGDYQHLLTEQFQNDDQLLIRSGIHNAHNQYLEMILALGIPGCLVMLLMLSWPLWGEFRWRTARLACLMTTLLVMTNLLFESMLERQMGLQFVSLTYCAMALIISAEKNKFVGIEKS